MLRMFLEPAVRQQLGELFTLAHGKRVERCPGVAHPQVLGNDLGKPDENIVEIRQYVDIIGTGTLDERVPGARRTTTCITSKEWVQTRFYVVLARDRARSIRLYCFHIAFQRLDFT